MGTSSKRKISIEGYNNSSAKILPIGSVLFTSRAGIGKTAILSQEGCTNQGFQSIVPHKNILDTYFIFSRTEELKKYGETISSGSTFVEVSGKQMLNMMLMMPKTLEEQQKIGSFFQSLDTLIALHQRKCEQLENIKKALLEKMFPNADETTPKIRFKGYTKKWSKYQLKNIIQTISFKLFLKEPEQNGKFEIIQQGNEPIIGFANGIPCSNYNDIVIFGDHTLSLYKPKNPFFVATDGVRIITGKKKIDGEYLLSLLEKYKPKNEGYKRYYSILENSNCFHSNIKNEQISIGTFFNTLDRLITLQQQKITQLKSVKQALLQQMFV